MEETRRYLRYIIPGVIFLVLLFIGFFIFDKEYLFESIRATIDSGAGVLGSVVIAGGLGYIFSTVYFGIRWSANYHGFYYDHLTTILELNHLNKLRIQNYSGSDITKQIDKYDAWIIVNCYWHERKKISRIIKGVDSKIDSYYSDFTHGLGTTLVATIFSFVTFIALSAPKICHGFYYCNFIFAMVFYIVFIVICSINFHKTSKAYIDMVNHAFAESIRRTKKSDPPINIKYNKKSPTDEQ